MLSDKLIENMPRVMHATNAHCMFRLGALLMDLQVRTEVMLGAPFSFRRLESSPSLSPCNQCAVQPQTRDTAEGSSCVGFVGKNQNLYDNAGHSLSSGSCLKRSVCLPIMPLLAGQQGIEV